MDADDISITTDNDDDDDESDWIILDLTDCESEIESPVKIHQPLYQDDNDPKDLNAKVHEDSIGSKQTASVSNQHYLDQDDKSNPFPKISFNSSSKDSALVTENDKNSGQMLTDFKQFSAMTDQNGINIVPSSASSKNVPFFPDSSTSEMPLNNQPETESLEQINSKTDLQKVGEINESKNSVLSDESTSFYEHSEASSCDSNSNFTKLQKKHECTNHMCLAQNNSNTHKLLLSKTESSSHDVPEIDNNESSKSNLAVLPESPENSSFLSEELADTFCMPNSIVPNNVDETSNQGSFVEDLTDEENSNDSIVFLQTEVKDPSWSNGTQISKKKLPLCFVKLEPLTDDFIQTLTKIKSEPNLDWIKTEPCLDNKYEQDHQNSESNTLNEDVKPLRCEECGVLFTKQVQLNNHMRFHAENPKRQCEVCLRLCLNSRDLKIHMEFHLEDLSNPHRCDVCGTNFDGKEELRKHKETHGSKPFQCCICYLTFKQKSMLHDHTIEHDEYVYHCERCAKSFKYQLGLEMHKKDHGVDKKSDYMQKKQKQHKRKGNTTIYYCDYCSQTFTNRRKCERHKSKTHLRRKKTSKAKYIYQCAHCEYSCKYSSVLQHHMKVHEKQNFKCTICSKAFRTESGLHTHMCEHTGLKPNTCEVCDHTALSYCDLKKHIRKHTGERPFKCSKCESTFSSNSSLHTHERIHNKERHSCEYCSKTFSSKYSRNAHLKIHTGDVVTKCDVCNIVFASKRSLECHYRIHTQDEEFKCKFCNKICFHATSLKLHLRVHTNERPYKCDFCKKSFKSLKDRRVHVRTHTGEKPYKCDLCDWAFAQHAALKKHKMAHAGVKKFICVVCNAAFVQKGSLKHHELIHTGEKPHGCEICGKTFSRKFILNTHMVSHTGEKKYTCNICSKAFGFRSNWRKHEKLCERNLQNIKVDLDGLESASDCDLDMSDINLAEIKLEPIKVKKSKKSGKKR